MYGINQSWHIRFFHNFFYFESSKCYEFKGFLQWNFITESVSEILFSRIRFNKKSCNSLRSLCLCFALSYFSTRFKNYMPNRLLSRCYATLPPASPSEPRRLGHNPSEQLLTVIVRPPLKHSLQSPDSRVCPQYDGFLFPFCSPKYSPKFDS
jgi:hypothetical protein